MNKIGVTVQYEKDLHRKLKDRAASDGVSIADLVRKAVNFYLSFDETLMRTAQTFGARMGLPPGQIIENYAIRVIAEQDAYREIYDAELPGFMRDTFVWQESERKPRTGNELYDELKNRFEKKFRAEQEAEILEQLQRTGGREDLLSDHAREIWEQMKKRDRGFMERLNPKSE